MKTLGVLLTLLLLCAGTFKTDSTDLNAVNNTANDLGVCTFSGGGNSVQFEVAPNSNYDDPIDFTVDSVTIEGQTVTEPSDGPVTLTNGAQVIVQCPSTNYVEIWSTEKTTTPVQ
ncbi:MAG TPA: hypothetical protein VFH95_10610 [Candidatus Kapabacteria bacterium]|nr:hypothetical protein [Candidatus Kapabacteria bacterium]